MASTRSMRFGPNRLTKSAAEEYSSSDSDSDQDGLDSQIPSTNPNEDDFAEYQHRRKRRRTGRDVKESAALGIFGSDSEDDGPGSRWKHKQLRNKGMTFVSSTDKKGGEEEEDDDNDEYCNGTNSMRARASNDDEGKDDEDEEETAAGVLGLGFAAQRVVQDTSWSVGSRPAHAQPTLSKTKTKPNASAPLGRGFVPTSSSIPELKVRDDSPPPQIARPSAFSSGGGKSAGKPNPNSFGARMMAKMGYKEGSGLGKEGQGRNVIIEANLRPQRAGLGVVKEKTESERKEEKRQARLRGEVVVDSDEEENKKKAAARKNKLLGRGGSVSTPGSGTSTPKRQKQKYLTLDEVKKAAPGLSIPEAFTPILDLTGPGRKVLTSSSGLMTPTGANAATSTETADQAESKKLARRAQNDFLAIVEEWQGLQERKAYAELRLEQERQELDQLEAELAEYKSTVAQFDNLTLSSTDEATDVGQEWDRVIATLKAASDSISESSRDAMKEELAAVAISAIHPVFKSSLQSWDLTEDSGARLASDLVSIGDLIGLSSSQALQLQQPLLHHRKGTATPYETMMYQIWLPHMARAARDWDVRDSTEKMLSLFETWKPLMPNFVRTQLLEQDIIRKLDEAVAKWEPKRRSSRYHGQTLPHMWLFPWLQHLPSRHLNPKSSTGLVADVRRKFRQLIDVWEFDRGVIPGLERWKEILRPTRKEDEWHPLVMSHVLPSMTRYLRKNFQVDPSDQEPFMPMLMGIFKWLDLIRPSMIAEVVVAEVFPKWHDALYEWLTQDGVEYDQVFEWVQWWQGEVFPADLKDVPSITAEFDKGISLIGDATILPKDQLLPRPDKGPALCTATSTTKKSPPPSQLQTPVRIAPMNDLKDAAAAARATLRSQVEDWCHLHDLQFIPERNKTHDQGPLFRITSRGDGKGGLLTYIKGGALVYEPKAGEPVRMKTLEEFEKGFLVRYMGLGGG